MTERREHRARDLLTLEVRLPESSRPAHNEHFALQPPAMSIQIPNMRCSIAQPIRVQQDDSYEIVNRYRAVSQAQELRKLACPRRSCGYGG
jgi:hypothetical protein